MLFSNWIFKSSFTHGYTCIDTNSWHFSNCQIAIYNVFSTNVKTFNLLLSCCQKYFVNSWLSLPEWIFSILKTWISLFVTKSSSNFHINIFHRTKSERIFIYIKRVVKILHSFRISKINFCIASLRLTSYCCSTL